MKKRPFKTRIPLILGILGAIGGIFLVGFLFGVSYRSSGSPGVQTLAVEESREAAPAPTEGAAEASDPGEAQTPDEAQALTPTPGPTGTQAATPTPGPTGTQDSTPAPGPTGTQTPTPTPAPEVTVHFLDVGQGAAALIESHGHFMMIDGGGRDRSSYVVAYLKKFGVRKLDYVVASHYDEDHIAGLVGIFNVFTVDTILEPGYATESNIYDSYVRDGVENGASVVTPLPGDTFALGSATFTVLGPSRWDHLNENDNSLCILVTCGGNRFLFTGDATAEAENELISLGLPLAADVYVCGHHGSSTSSTEGLLDAVAPRYAVISCGRQNPYGHPDRAVLDRMKERGIEVFRTDEQGAFSVRSDGTELTWSTVPSTTWAAGIIPTVQSGSGDDAASSKEGGRCRYILNTHSMKFHSPDCASVGKISPKNYAETDKTRGELIAEGYSPCGSCRP